MEGEVAGITPQNPGTEPEERDETACDPYRRTRRARLPGQCNQPRFAALARSAPSTVGGPHPAYRRRSKRKLQPAHRLRTRRVQGRAHARTPEVRCGEGPLDVVLALAVWIRQKRRPLLASARAY